MDDPRPAIVRSIARRNHADEARRAVKARPVPLTKKLAADDALRLVLLECLAQVSANAGAVRSGRQAESLHQLRVGLRRLQVALSAFGEELRSPLFKELQDRNKAIASRLGPARDFDVFLGELLPAPEKSAGGGDGYAGLRARAEAARETAWDAVVECVVSADFGRFLDDVAGVAERNLLRGGKPPRIPAAAERVLDAHLSRVRKRARKAKSLTERDLHRLRIALKKLRYASEFFAPLYRRKAVGRYTRRLKDLQDCLGRLNDIVHLRTTLSQLLVEETPSPRSEDIRFVAGQVDGWHRARGAQLTKNALGCWDRFRRVDPFWR